MINLEKWLETAKPVPDFDCRARPVAIPDRDRPAFWARVIPGITPDVAMRAMRNLDTVARRFAITLPDEYESAYDPLGRVIVATSHVEGRVLWDDLQYPQDDTIEAFRAAYVADPLYHDHAIGDLHHKRNYMIDTVGRIRFLDVGYIMPSNDFFMS